MRKIYRKMLRLSKSYILYLNPNKVGDVNVKNFC